MDNKQALSKQQGFVITMLVIGISTLGVLATVSVDRWEETSQGTEFHNVQSAVIAMMVDNNINTIPNPITIATNDMGAYPDAATPATAKGLSAGEKGGYLLYGHDKVADGETWPTANYISFAKTIWTYTIYKDGTVVQGARIRSIDEKAKGGGD